MRDNEVFKSRHPGLGFSYLFIILPLGVYIILCQSQKKKEKTSEKESLRYLSVISVLFLEESPVPISIVIYIWGCLENEL